MSDTVLKTGSESVVQELARLRAEVETAKVTIRATRKQLEESEARGLREHRRANRLADDVSRLARTLDRISAQLE